MNIDYNAFEGFQVKGFTKTVLSRGRVIIDNGEYLGRPGDGSYIKRGPYGGMYTPSKSGKIPDIAPGARSSQY
jgi:dihydropyrimidinase